MLNRLVKKSGDSEIWNTGQILLFPVSGNVFKINNIGEGVAESQLLLPKEIQQNYHVS